MFRQYLGQELYPTVHLPFSAMFIRNILGDIGGMASLFIGISMLGMFEAAIAFV